MTDKPDNSDPQLESMLRQWGAAQAADTQDLPSLPQIDAPAGRSALRKILLPLSIAASLVVGLCFGVIYARSTVPTSPTGSVESAARDAALRKAEEQLQTLRQEYTLALAGLRSELSQSQQMQKDTNQKYLARSEQFEAATKKAQLQQELIARQADMIRQGEKYKTLLAQANEELQRTRGLHEKEIASHRKTTAALQTATARLTAIKAQQADLATLRRDMRKIYLSIAAPDKAGLAALQAAARKGRLVDRCEAVRKSSPAADQFTFEKIETLLMRLDLLDPANPQAVEGWKKAVQRSNLVAGIDQLAAGSTLDEMTRRFLLEVAMILGGADDAA